MTTNDDNGNDVDVDDDDDDNDVCTHFSIITIILYVKYAFFYF